MSNVIDQITDENGSIDARRVNTGDPPEPDRRVTARACYRLRVALLHGATLADHVTAWDFSDGSAHPHAVGACGHGDDHGVPPLRHDTTGSRGGTWVIDQ